MNNRNDRILKYGITVAALFIALAHLVWPNLTIDAITLALFFIALIPWLSPLFKSLKFPGGWEVQFQEVKEKVDSIVAKETEPVGETSGPMFSVRMISVNDDVTRSVLKALGDPRYTWRYIGGLMQETKLPAKEVLRAITWLLDNDLATESKVRDRRQWALSQEGRDLLNNILRDEQSTKTT